MPDFQNVGPRIFKNTENVALISRSVHNSVYLIGPYAFIKTADVKLITNANTQRVPSNSVTIAQKFTIDQVFSSKTQYPNNPPSQTLIPRIP